MINAALSRLIVRPGHALIAPLALLGLSLAGVSQATPITFNFAPGHYGATTYAVNQYLGSNSTSLMFSDTQNLSALTAYAYKMETVGPDSQAHLVCKLTNNDPSETGLGINEDPGGGHEIDAYHYVQLDLSFLKHQGYNDLMFKIGSVQSGEQFHIYGSKALGSIGTELAHGTGGNIDSVSISNTDLGLYQYFSISGGGPNKNGNIHQTGDVLILNGLSLDPNTLSIPEPAFYQMGVFVAGGGLMALRLRRKNRK